MSGPPLHTLEWPTHDLLTHRVRTTPDRTALIDVTTEETWNYRELSTQVDSLLQTAAFDGEGPIGLLLEPGPAIVLALFGAMRTGRTAVPLHLAEQPDVLAAAAQRAGAETVWYGERTAELAAALEAERTAEGIQMFSIDDHVQKAADHRDPSMADRESKPPVVEPASLTRSTRALVLFTSGTVGEPKGVQLTVGNLIGSATASAFRLGVSPEDRWLCCLPTSHMGGLAPIVRSTLYGTTVVIQRTFDVDATASALERHDITGVSLVPTLLARLLDAGWRPPDSLRVVLLGGAPATPALIDRCQAAGVPVHPTYGATETASQIATARPPEAFANPESVGQPLVCTDVTIVDKDGNPLEAGETGEIVVNGPTVTPGYLSRAHTAASFSEYGYHTGDLGTLDANCRLTVSGRLTDQIITGGENVDPAEVGQTLQCHPAVTDAAVVGLPDEEWGERVCALVGVEDEAVTVDELHAHCRRRLAGFKRPKMIRIAERVPRTGSGTVDRAAVRAALEETTNGSGDS